MRNSIITIIADCCHPVRRAVAGSERQFQRRIDRRRFRCTGRRDRRRPGRLHHRCSDRREGWRHDAPEGGAHRRTAGCVASSDNTVVKLENDVDELSSEIDRLQNVARPELVSLLQAGIDMDLLFRTDEAVLADMTGDRLAQLAGMLAGMTDIHIQLDGFADERGDADYNLVLSERRVQFIRDQLVAAGIHPNRINMSAHGESAAAGPDTRQLCPRTPRQRQAVHRQHAVIGRESRPIFPVTHLSLRLAGPVTGSAFFCYCLLPPKRRVTHV